MTALAITVDVDGEAGLPDGGDGYADRLSSRSERAYGLLRGLPRLLRVLDDYDARATFYVPGVTAARHPGPIRAIADRGHELGHHGHTHRRPDLLTADEQRDEIERGLAALSPFGARPAGYRAPGWELTPTTLALLAEYGFRYDSSLMGDDRPYVIPAGSRTIVELPVHWSLDDVPHFALHAHPEAVARVWIEEADIAWREARVLTLTMHPEITGRPHRLRLIESLLAHLDEQRIATTTHAEAARDALAGA
jgi:peptidoglycan-N-acetylglucosamine deacetylase